MNSKETLKILSVINEMYPNFLRERNVDSTVTIWQKIFADTPYDTVNKAVIAFATMDEKGFPPVPGQINAMIRKLTGEGVKGRTEVEAWNLVLKALNGALYWADEKFSALPDDVKRIVGSPKTLMDWAKLPEDEVHTVVASNFQRSYRARKQAEQEWVAIPESLRVALPPTQESQVQKLEIPKENPEDFSQGVDMPESVREIATKLGLFGGGG